MSNQVFKASNGIEIDANAGRLRVIKSERLPALHIMGTGTTEALAEFFQAERDEELGRWRNPDKPNEVVYRHDDVCITVLDEGDGERRAWWTRGDALDASHSSYFGFESARAYYAAHPEPEPEPWEEAETGEVWLLTRFGAEEPFLVTGGEFIASDLAVAIDLDDATITAGLRIWPALKEGDGDE